MRAVDLSGGTFGRLTAIRYSSTYRQPSGVTRRRYLCACSCNSPTGLLEVRANLLQSGQATSCGCVRREMAGKLTKPTHGHAAKYRESLTYKSWKAMRGRLAYHRKYVDVTVDPRWGVFANFLADMGTRPEGKTLDRVNNELGYWKANCRWATPKEQAQNRRKYARAA